MLDRQVFRNRDWILAVKRRMHQLAGFAVVGVVATAIQYGILAVSVSLCDLRADIGSGIGFVGSASVNYLLNHRCTFRSTRPHSSALWRFLAVASVGLLLNVSLMALLAGRWHVHYLLAQVPVTGLTLLWNFIGSAFFSFADPVRQARPVSGGVPK